MKDTQILSAFADTTVRLPSDGQNTPLKQVSVFDACHVGVVLRTVLLVQAVLGVVALFGAATLLDWLNQLALMTGAVLPATLLWLVVACGLKRPLGRLLGWAQVLVGTLLGTLCGIYACWVLTMLDLPGQTPWLASAAAGSLMAAILVVALQWRARAQVPAAQAARLALLQARIRPHFLFNTLNSAIALVRDEPAKAEQVLEDLSDLFRRALAEPGSSVTLKQELELAAQYLAIESLRFGERLRVQWRLDPAAQEAQLPPLLLQPLLENAVKHGVEPSLLGADIQVSTRRKGSRVVIRVCNTLDAHAVHSAGLGLALANVRERLMLLHDVQAMFDARIKQGQFQVRIEVPL